MTMARKIQEPMPGPQRRGVEAGSTWKAAKWFRSAACERISPVLARFLRRCHRRLAFVSSGGQGGGVRTPTTCP